MCQGIGGAREVRVMAEEELKERKKLKFIKNIPGDPSFILILHKKLLLTGK